MKLDDFILALIEQDREALTVSEGQVYEWIKTGHLTKRHFALWCNLVRLEN